MPVSTTPERTPEPGAPEAGGAKRGRRRRTGLHPVLELVVIAAIAVGLALLIQAFFVKPYRIPTGSMEPTIVEGQRVLVDRIGESFSEPEIGEIAVFHPPAVAERELCGPVPHRVTPGRAACSHPVEREGTVTFIKRVVAGPGDWLYVKEGHVYLSTTGRHGSFRREKDSFIKPCGEVQECNFLTPIRVPAGHWFMMGDNRGNSDDSRFWGPVPTAWIIGEAFATYWPPERIGLL